MLKVDELLKTSDDEKKLGDFILEAASTQIRAAFDADPSQRVFEINRKPIVSSAQSKIKGASVNHRVRAYMVEQAKEGRWKLEDLAGDKGDKMIFTMRKRGGGRKKKNTTETATTETATTETATTETATEDK